VYFVAGRTRVGTSDMSSTLFFTTVCPVDFSDYSLRALRYAVALAGRLGGRLTVLHIANPLLLQAAARAYDVAAMSRDTEVELRTLADAVISDAGAVTLGIRTVVRSGDPVTEIIRCGEDEHADLIVMGTHGRSGYRRMFFGSVTEQVLRRSSVPVLAVPPSGLKHREAPADASMVLGEHRHL
jgi:nucleotide-binding universal stress UspA family protein